MKKTILLILATILVLFGCASTPPSKDVVSITEGTYEGRDYIKIESSRYPKVYVRVYSLSDMPIHPNYERVYDDVVYIPDGYEYMDYTVDKTYNGSHSVYVTLKYDSLKDRRLCEAPTSVPQELKDRIKEAEPPTRADNELYKGKAFVMGDKTHYCVDAVGRSYFTDEYVDTQDTVMHTYVDDGLGMTALVVTIVQRTDYLSANKVAAYIQNHIGQSSVYKAKATENSPLQDIRVTIIDSFTHGFDNGTYTHVMTYKFSQRWKDSTIILWDNAGDMVYSGPVNKL